MSGPAPVIFGSGARQRLLCVLAMRGPQPLRLALRTASALWREPLLSLERVGLVARAGKLANEEIAISDSFPARVVLIRLLKHLGTHYAFSVPAAPASSTLFRNRMKKSAATATIDEMLGWRDRLYVFLALEALGGQSDLRELNAALPEIASDVIRNNLAKFRTRGVFAAMSYHLPSKGTAVPRSFLSGERRIPHVTQR